VRRAALNASDAVRSLAAPRRAARNRRRSTRGLYFTPTHHNRLRAVHHFRIGIHRVALQTGPFLSILLCCCHTHVSFWGDLCVVCGVGVGRVSCVYEGELSPDGIACTAGGIVLFTCIATHSISFARPKRSELKARARGGLRPRRAVRPPLLSARFNAPKGLVIAAEEMCAYVCDSKNHCVRRVPLPNALLTASKFCRFGSGSALCLIFCLPVCVCVPCVAESARTARAAAPPPSAAFLRNERKDGCKCPTAPHIR
jgi:hypothetical protein